MTAWRHPEIRTLLLYAQDKRGMGHINRTLTIARHLLAVHPNLAVYIATKSSIPSSFTLPERCDYVKLPRRMTPPCVLRSEENNQAAREHFHAVRSRILCETALGLEPDLVLVDHEPLGIKGEFREGLYALKAASSHTRFVFGLRDIMDDPAGIRASWEQTGVYEAFLDLYDGIAVYGSAALYDVAEAYAIPRAVRSKLHYCGYIVRDLPTDDPAALRAQYRLPRDGPLILATVGSGYDGYPVLAAALDAIGRLEARFPGLTAVCVTGPFMPPELQAQLRARATPTCRVLSLADTFGLMSAADAIVSMGGYNSVCEALTLGRPLVIVPRATHKIEQQIRAELLASRGLVRWVHPSGLDGQTLAESLDWALRHDRKDYARRVHGIIPSFDGAARLTQYLSPWLDAPTT